MAEKEHLIRAIKEYIDKNASSIIDDRGQHLWRKGHVSYVRKMPPKILEFVVESSGHDHEYLVAINLNDPADIDSDCSCPYDWGGICKHQVAVFQAILQDKNLLDFASSNIADGYGFDDEDLDLEEDPEQEEDATPMDLTAFPTARNDVPTEQVLMGLSGIEQTSDETALGYTLIPSGTDSGLEVLDTKLIHGRIRKDGSMHKNTVRAVGNFYPVDDLLKDIQPEDQEVISLMERNNQMGPWLNRHIHHVTGKGVGWLSPSDKKENQRALFRLNDYAAIYLGYLREFLDKTKDKYLYFYHGKGDRQNIAAKLLKPLAVQTGNELSTRLHVHQMEDRTQIRFFITLNGDDLPFPLQAPYYPPWIHITQNGDLFQWKSHHHFLLAAYFGFRETAVIEVEPEQWPKMFKEFIQKVQNQIPVEMDENMQPQRQEQKPAAKINLSETGEFLLFYPVITYGHLEVMLNEDGDKLYDYSDDRLTVIHRDKDFEQEIRDFIVDLHPRFNPFSEQEYYFLHADEVMKRMWFFDFYEKCRERGIEVYGIRSLKNIRYNPAKPKTSFSVNSGIDWFDMDMKVQFGDQQASLKEVRKAVMKRQNYVKLGEDTWGILPGEWLEQWANLLKFGKVEDGKLKVSKLHFHLVDRLYKQLDNKRLKKEIREKKKLLKSFEKIEPVEKPQGLQAELRDYQQSGLNWMAFLMKFGWGGILADDMGLGKTLQMLALFRHIQQANGSEKLTFLVVAPTTLLFNWENEILKFTPNMSYRIHWGPQRDKDTAEWADDDVILATYGTLTRDIDWIRHFRFTTAVLDESQAIKNPTSLRFKAVSLIDARYRFTLTGTPIENNTMELYAQMQFVNPGLLGSQKFFQKEYALPIDKEKDQQKTRELQQLIKPFLLRRTKEKVASELPPKTEIPLYCEMDKEQRRVYEAFKKEYREKVLSKVDEVGLDQARFNVLEALTRLRQICDSPAIMNTEEDYGSSSVKLQELMRHIREKTGDHKVLIFSQFVTMLSLVTRELEQEGVAYSYLDGSTRDRKKAVQDFQDNGDCRVMVISLKAGGLGLNLTEADYIYLIDPWWNPAVEQQAIDRTHRIGQEKHIFAYKMICKDTVEDKILKLQENKKTLAADLISAEQSFVKQLTEKDIRAIFE
jgi:superfamily II DNA or RNA helicase